MTRLPRLLPAALFLIFVLADSLIFAQFAGGTGTESDPWLIQTRGQLELLNNYLGSEHTDKHYRQIADINLGDAPWNPIARTSPFYGEYNGDGFAINNLNISDYLSGPSGLLAYVTDACFRNVNLRNVYLDFTYNLYPSFGNIGSVASLAVICAGSVFDNCHASGIVNVYAQNGSISLVGGLLGETDSGSAISNSSFSGSVSLSSVMEISMPTPGVDTAGGLVASNSGFISRSGNYADVSSSLTYVPPNPVPGTSSGSSNIGGITGINHGEITECSNYGSVSGSFYIGGIAGLNYSSITKCYSTTGSVSGTASYGGLVGANGGTVTDSWSGSIILYTMYDPWSMPPYWGCGGGLIGSDYGTVSNSYSNSNVYIYEYYWGGGFVGESANGVTHCYWNTEVSGMAYSASGEGRMTADMTYPYSDSTYVGWDFINVWEDDNQGFYNSGYPFFQWQTSAPYIFFNASEITDYAPLSVQFNDKSISYISGTLIYLWDFGDGETSSLQNPSHTYLMPGIYTVSLTVTNPNNSSSTYVRTEYIHAIERIQVIQLETSEQLNFGSINVEEYSASLPVTISSVGGASLQLSDLHFLTAESQFQILQPLLEMTIPHSESRTFLLRFAPLTVGIIIDTLFIMSNAVNVPILKIKLSGMGLYVPPMVPQNLILTMNGNDGNLTWDPVTQNTHNQPLIPDYYFVYFNGSQDINGDYYFLGLSTNTQYTHLNVGLGSQHMFYRVKAIKLYRDDQTSPSWAEYLKVKLKPGLSEASVRKVLQEFPGRNSARLRDDL